MEVGKFLLDAVIECLPPSAASVFVNPVDPNVFMLSNANSRISLVAEPEFCELDIMRAGTQLLNVVVTPEGRESFVSVRILADGEETKTHLVDSTDAECFKYIKRELADAISGLDSLLV